MKTKTIAAVTRAAGAPFSLEEVELDEPRSYEALIRMVATGVCATDLAGRAGGFPFAPGVLGHEGAGVVEAVGSAVQRVKAGDHVLATFTSDGRCPNCLDGHPAHCYNWMRLNFGGTRVDGSPTVQHNGTPLHAHFFGQSSFARHALVDERSLVKVASDAPLDMLAPLGCGIQTGAGAVLNVLRPEPGSTLVVFGPGTVGLSAIMGATLTGADRIIAVGRHPARLGFARELGATDTIDTGSTDAVKAIMDLTAGQGVQYAIEATGNVTVLGQAIQVLAPRGTCGVIGVPAFGTSVPVDVGFLIGGRRVIGITEGDSDPELFIPALARLYAQGRFPLDRIIRHYPFAQIEQAAADAHAGVTVKPVLTYN